MHANLAVSEESRGENTFGRAERNLLLAILNRAILDFAGTDSEESASAEEWFYNTEDENEEFSYPWICAHLDIEPTSMLQGIETLRRTNRENNQTKRWYLVRGSHKEAA